MGELLLQQRLDQRPQIAGLHHHGVAAGDQYIGDLPMFPQVGLEFAGLFGGNLQVLVAHELGPAETEGAIAVADLPGRGEEQHGFAIFVLETVDALPVDGRNVVFQLACRVWIQAGPDICDDGIPLGPGQVLPQGVGDPLKSLGFEHLPLREQQLKDRVLRYPVPVDQLVDYIVVDPEGQHAGHHLHLKAKRLGEPRQLGNAIHLPGGIDLESLWRKLLGFRGQGLFLGNRHYSLRRRHRAPSSQIVDCRFTPWARVMGSRRLRATGLHCC